MITLVPQHSELKKMIEIVRSIVFPELFPSTEPLQLQLQAILTHQLSTVTSDNQQAAHIACEFLATMPQITCLLHSDVDAVMANDPAVVDRAEVVYCYPLVWEMLHYRVAHQLLLMGVPLLPRMLTEMAHSDTGIDIHPAASIGDHFCIDHGTGVVIGATTIIGSNVVLYQGVTLGARNIKHDNDGRPIDEPRHPIIEDNVTIYSNTSVLGRITIGHDTVVGGNIWLTHDVPPHSRIVQEQPSK